MPIDENLSKCAEFFKGIRYDQGIARTKRGDSALKITTVHDAD